MYNVKTMKEDIYFYKPKKKNQVKTSVFQQKAAQILTYVLADCLAWMCTLSMR